MKDSEYFETILGTSSSNLRRIAVGQYLDLIYTFPTHIGPTHPLSFQSRIALFPLLVLFPSLTNLTNIFLGMEKQSGLNMFEDLCIMIQLSSLQRQSVINEENKTLYFCKNLIGLLCLPQLYVYLSSKLKMSMQVTYRSIRPNAILVSH